MDGSSMIIEERLLFARGYEVVQRIKALPQYNECVSRPTGRPKLSRVQHVG